MVVSNNFYFHPYILGKMIHILTNIFSDGLKPPPPPGNLRVFSSVFYDPRFLFPVPNGRRLGVRPSTNIGCICWKEFGREVGDSNAGGEVSQLFPKAKKRMKHFLLMIVLVGFFWF